MFLNQKPKTSQILAFAGILIINFIFGYKYFSRATTHALLLNFVYISFLGIIFIAVPRFNTAMQRSNRAYYILLFLYAAAYLIIFRLIPVQTLNVDRWSVISSFWQQAFSGKYPYNAVSHMGNYPAPLPFYFLIALPFFMLGEIGLLSITGFILLAVFLRKALSPANSSGALLVLMLSVSIFWEISARSTILVNTVLFFFYFFWLLKIDLNHSRLFWISAICGGLLLSTRTIFALPLAIFCIQTLRSNSLTIGRLVAWAAIVCGTLVITFIPFLVFFLPEFITRNPFNVQTDHLFPFSISAGFMILAVIFGFFCRNKSDVLVFTTIILCMVLLVYVLLFASRFGFMSAYLNSYVDISYLLFIFPFLLYYSFRKSQDVMV